MENEMKRFFEMALRRLYSAENQTYDFLNMTAGKAQSSQFKELLLQHRKETAVQVDRLKEIFSLLQIDIAKTKVGEAEGILEKGKEIVKSLATMAFVGKSKAMEGAIEEATEMGHHFEGAECLDVVLMCGGQGIEMGEMAAYEVLCMMAEDAGLREIAGLLKSSLGEERRMHDALTEMLKRELQVLKSA